MTEKQLKFFYFKLWNRAMDAHDWRMDKGRLVGKRQASYGAAEVNELYQLIWKLAEASAAAEHRAVKPDDLRHAVHRAALGKDKSAKDLTNAELDRVASVFKLLRDPDDLDAVLDYTHPENQARDRLLYSIERMAPDAYIQHVADGRFRGQDWRALDHEDLRELANKLRARKQSWNSKHLTSVPAVPSVATTDPEPLTTENTESTEKQTTNPF